MAIGFFIIIFISLIIFVCAGVFGDVGTGLLQTGGDAVQRIFKFK
jgi:hypothetical protein